jgi:anti-repressor protein
MNELRIFEHPEFGKVRTKVDEQGEILWCGADVCRALELGNPRSSLALLDDDEKGVHTMDTPGGSQDLVFVYEAGLYSLIFRSRKHAAKEFKRWVTHEILPSIRQTGTYSVVTAQEPESEDSVILRSIVILQGRVEKLTAANTALTAKIEADAPDVKFAGYWKAGPNDIEVGELCALLNAAGYKIGRNDLFKKLRDLGWLIKQTGCRYNMPTQKAVERGYIVEKASTIETYTGKVAKITPLGQQYFLEYFLGQRRQRLISFEGVPLSPLNH